jgi:hypothetical protein
MSLVIDNRPALQGKPGFHAFIVGVSAYTNLPAPEQPANPASFGMRQLSATALSAYKVYQWLLKCQANLPMPLATCRLLLSPTPAEFQKEPGLQGLGTSCVLNHFLKDAKEWREDVSAQAENIAFFYFAGHGIQRSKTDQVLLLEDFNDGIGGVLRNSVDVHSLRNGMAPSPKRPNIGRTQFYFIDACRNLPFQITDFEKLDATAVFDVELSGFDDRRAPIFHAAIPDGKGFAVPLEQTLFSKVLLECLEGSAAESPETDGEIRWHVSYKSLSEVLHDQLEALSKGFGVEQPSVADGFGKDAIICYLDSAPEVPTVFEVEPSDASTQTHVRILDDDGMPVRELPLPLSPHPYSEKLPAGFYQFVVTIEPPTSPYINRQMAKPVKLPSTTLRLRVLP